MRPCPEIAMPVSAVMSLHSEPQRVSRECASIECDFSREHCVRVWRAREANPSLIAQRHAKRGTVAQVPGDGASVHLQRSTARIFFNAIVANSKMKWALPSGTDVQSLQRKSLNKALRRSACREPGGPNLNGEGLRFSGAAAATGVHQQIAKPPRFAPVRQAHT